MATYKDDLIIVFQHDDDKLSVLDDPQGKSLIYFTAAEESVADIFKVNISHLSLKKIRDRSRRKIFNWVIKGGSLEINGKDDSWELVFLRQDNQEKCRVFLGKEETECLKKVLFSKLSCE